MRLPPRLDDYRHPGVPLLVAHDVDDIDTGDVTLVPCELHCDLTRLMIGAWEPLRGLTADLRQVEALLIRGRVRLWSGHIIVDLVRRGEHMLSPQRHFVDSVHASGLRAVLDTGAPSVAAR